VSCYDDLRRIVQQQTKRGLRLQFVKENLTFTGEDSPMARLMLSIKENAERQKPWSARGGFPLQARAGGVAHQNHRLCIQETAAE
jgi:hypothetical protein